MRLENQLRYERERREWSQVFVAGALKIPIATLAEWEEGLSVPSATFCEQLYILFGEETQTLGLPPLWDNAARFSRPPENATFLLLPPLKEGQSVISSFTPAQLSERERGIRDPALPLKGTKELIGRNALFAQLKRWLCLEDGSTLTALVGIPGVGKTALALEIAYDQEIYRRFPDGILWAGLGPNPNIVGVFSRWGTWLDISPPDTGRERDTETWATALRSALAPRRMLLIVDDVWTQADALAFQPGSTGCACLITTRFNSVATSIAHEKTLTIPELNEEDGVMLLARFAPEVVAADFSAARTLVHAVGGLPLALVLISKYLRQHAYSGQPRRLRTALTQLRQASYRLSLTDPSMPTHFDPGASQGSSLSLQSVISMSDQHLEKPAQAALRALSVFPPKPNSFTREAALAVAQSPHEALDQLSDAGLLEHDSANRYLVHQIIADYARLLLQEIVVYERFILYYVHFVQMHQTDYRVLEQDSTNILAALDLAFEQQRKEALLQGVGAFACFLHLRGLYALAALHLRRAHEVAMHLEDSLSIVKTLLLLGENAQKRGDYAHAETLLREGLVRARSLEDFQQMSALLLSLGEVAKEQGNYGQADVYLQEGMTLAQRLGLRTSLCQLLIGRGAVAREQGNYRQAETYYREALDLARGEGHTEQISTLLKNLGVLALERGEYSQAEAYYQEGLILARQIGHRDLTSLLLMNLGALALERGMYGQAEMYSQEALTLARNMGHRERISVLLSNLGVLADARGNYAEAEEILQEGLALARQIGHPERLSLLLLNLGVVADRQGNEQTAETYYREGVTIARQIGHPERLSLLLLNLGAVATERGDYAQAESNLQEGLALARQIGHRERTSDLLVHLATLAVKRGDDGNTKMYLQEGLSLAKQIGKPHLICTVLSIAGEFFLKQQKIKLAATAFHTILDIVPLEGHDLTALAYYGLAQVARMQDNIAEAHTLGKKSLMVFQSLGHRRANDVEQWLSMLPNTTETQY